MIFHRKHIDSSYLFDRSYPLGFLPNSLVPIDEEFLRPRRIFTRTIVYMLENTGSIKNLYIPIRYLGTWFPKDFKHASQRTLCIERPDIYRHFIGLFTPASDSIQQRRINIYHDETRGSTISRGTCRSHRKPL